MAKEIGNWSDRPQRPSALASATRGRWIDDSRAIIEPLLEPGERLIWHARGRGPDMSSHAIYAVAFFPLFAAFMAILMFTDGEPWKWKWGQPMIPMEVAVVASLILVLGTCLFVLALRGFFAPSQDRYGLTDRRIIIAERLWWRRERTYKPEQITLLEVRGSDRKGSVRLAPQKRRRVNRQHALIGIERPADVAELIRTALKPGLRVDRFPDKPYIPPIEPRRP